MKPKLTDFLSSALQILLSKSIWILKFRHTQKGRFKKSM